MIPADFPETNRTFTAPQGMSEEQVASIRAYTGTAPAGSCQGHPLTVVAWRPTAQEMCDLANGAPVFLTMMSAGLPPHFLSTSIEAATNPA